MKLKQTLNVNTDPKILNSGTYYPNFKLKKN